MKGLRVPFFGFAVVLVTLCSAQPLEALPSAFTPFWSREEIGGTGWGARSAPPGARQPSSVSCLDTPSPVVRVNSSGLFYSGLRLCPNEQYNFDQELFLGIRFARPPKGQLRWRRPVPLDSGDAHAPKTYAGERSQDGATISMATLYPLTCHYGTGNSVTALDEDCLGLNIVRPSSPFASKEGAHDDHLLPVLVWIYGGGFIAGSSSATYYNGSFLVQQAQEHGKPIIFVSINYRTLLGFNVKIPDNVKDEDDAKQGNIGYWDQRLALTWIHENIRDFGGDPKRVTLIGESAGAVSVLQHLAAFDGKDPYEAQHGALYRSVISQSPADSTREDSRWRDQSSHLAWKNWTNAASCKEDDFVCLRSLTQEKIAESALNGTGWHPRVDTSLSPRTLLQALQGGFFARDRAVLIGGVTDEGPGFAPRNLSSVQELRTNLITPQLIDDGNYVPPLGFFPRDASINETGQVHPVIEAKLDKLISLYGLPDSASTGAPIISPYGQPAPNIIDGVANAIWGDYLFVAVTRAYAKALVKYGTKTWKYRYSYLRQSHAPTVATPRGVYHFSEVALVPFINQLSWDQNVNALPPGDSPDLVVAKRTVKKWLDFVYDGRPTSNEEEWPEYGESAKNFVIDEEDSLEDDVFRKEQLDFVVDLILDRVKQ
ncbi:Acetylcholinesterase/Butyrylcholinesterase [Ceraceosorus bombacis]|uniref:Carboxylic ester hydrolase n=1 Tax=Ceraceosorus bombacis TaxID=401625 RepID=A0A0P1BQE3_9BASI|nr:Acetylcholinesterase/Butyrylcholinesterase [Ceraceosorus bombacis]